ncbi:MAG: right-handed parallel beta-helix repeat-containing protein, partial [Bacillota bacterium]|nr:right-handed parallel beta-helix repeat-containing protein [Bacillota bacterium]
MKNSSDINFEGITFEASCATVINMKDTKNNNIRGCTFRNLSEKAVNIENAYGCGLLGCDLYNIGKGAVDLGGGDRATLTDSKNYIKNCYFTRYNTRLFCSFYKAVELYGVGNIVANSVFHDSGGCAVWFNGNSNLIENNEFFDLDKITSDAGAVYAYGDWTAQGNVIRNNIFHDIIGGRGTGGARPVYLDERIGGTTVESNLFYNCSKPMFSNSGRDNIYDSNLIANCASSIWISTFTSSTDDVMNPYSVLMITYREAPVSNELWKKKYPKLLNLLNDKPGLPKDNTVVNNITYNSSDFVLSDEAKATCTMHDNVSIKDDSIFVDAGNNNFRIKDGQNPVSGFKALDYNNVGLKLDNDRTAMPDMSNFSLLSPENGSVAKSLVLTWQACTGAVKYHVQIAKDKGFNEIVVDKEVTLNSFEASELEYGNTKYYWKVTAERTSVNLPMQLENIGGVQSFETPLKGNVDTTVLSETVQQASKLFENIKTGDGIGESSSECKDAFSKAIENSKLVLVDKDLSQAKVNGTLKQLQEEVRKFKFSI